MDTKQAVFECRSNGVFRNINPFLLAKCTMSVYKISNKGNLMSGQFVQGIVERKVAKSEALPALKEPRKYKVILENDDYTPMEFVVDVLKHFFYLNEETATQVMLQVHYQGRGVCGIFTRDIAETKVLLVNEYSRINEHPLLCRMEPD